MNDWKIPKSVTKNEKGPSQLRREWKARSGVGPGSQGAGRWEPGSREAGRGELGSRGAGEPGAGPEEAASALINHRGHGAGTGSSA